MGIFIPFHKIKRDEKGQVAPFLILLIAVVITAMMVVFNVGKISMNKVNTENSADAGALAGSSMLASGENAIADQNAWMIASYLSAVAFCAVIPFEGIQPLEGSDFPWGIGFFLMIVYYAALEATQIT